MTRISFKAYRGRKLRFAAVLPLIAATSLVAACDKAPEGQVVAVVNGEEITLQELNAEIGNAQIPEGADGDAARNLALSRIIDRRLLGEIAKDQNIDSSPEFIMRRRQTEEALLVQLLSQQVARNLKQPTAAEIDAFIAENPQMFANRAALLLDQIRFQAPARDDYLQELASTKTMEQVIEVLNRLGIQFQRGNVRVDTAQIPLEMFNRVNEIGSSEPFIVPNPVGVTVSLVTARQAAPIAGEQARAAAANAIQQRALGAELEKQLKAAKAEAGIDYQSGFGPVAEGTAAPAAGAPAAGASPVTAPAS